MKSVAGLAILLLGLSLVRGQDCIFGTGCLLDCNCDGTCDQQTGCVDGNCSLTWDGPICQRENVAFNKSTSQSSTGVKNGVELTADLAVDGKVESGPNSTTCSKTRKQNDNSFWTVHLGKAYTVSSFNIYGRDGNKALTSFGLDLRLSGWNWTNCFKTAYFRTNTTFLQENCNLGTGTPTRGDTAKITTRTPLAMELCEVQIFACAEGTYGVECEKLCGNCSAGRTACHGITGDCPFPVSRCIAGYQQSKCNSACAEGTYGVECEKLCGNCSAGRTACHGITGDCPFPASRCIAGYGTSKCNSACTPGYYGPDCRETCGFCSESRTVCNRTSGECPDVEPRCSSGYDGPACKQACTPGYHGPDCRETCGFCSESRTVCNRTSGECPDVEPRCSFGYGGPACKQVDCKQLTAFIIGLSLAVVLVSIIVVVVVVVVVVLRRKKKPEVRETGEQKIGREPYSRME